MGIHAGILVIRRILDENRWAQFLRRIKHEFKDDPNVVEHSSFKDFNAQKELKERIQSNLPIYVQNMRTELASIIALYVEKKDVDKAMIQWLEIIDKYYNFYEGDRNIWRLNQIEDPSTFKADGWTSQLELNHIQKLKPVFDEIIGPKLQKIGWIQKSFKPFVSLIFEVGEHPRLPLFARHFKSFISKVNGRCGAAEPYLRRVFQIMQSYFPNQVIYFWNDNEHNGFGYDAEKDETSHSKQFYQQLLSGKDPRIPPSCVNCKVSAQKCNLKLCGNCKLVRYCSAKCQRKDWGNHAKLCKFRLASMRG